MSTEEKTSPTRMDILFGDNWNPEHVLRIRERNREEKIALAEEFRLFCDSKGLTMLSAPDGRICVYTPLDTPLFSFAGIDEEGKFIELEVAEPAV